MEKNIWIGKIFGSTKSKIQGFFKIFYTEQECRKWVDEMNGNGFEAWESDSIDEDFVQIW